MNNIIYTKLKIGKKFDICNENVLNNEGLS